MYGPLLRSSSCRKVYSVLCLVVLLASLNLSLSPAALAQEKLIAPMQYGTISVVDLTTLNAEEVITAGAYQAFALVGANPRLGFVGASTYLSVIDFTVGREVNRIYGVCAYPSGAFTTDKKYLLVEDACGYGYYQGLTVVNATTGNVVRRVNLSPALGQGAYNGSLGPVVVAGNKAYVPAQYGDPVLSPLAVLDLRTFKVKRVNVPSGFLDYSTLWTPNVAATPDQKYVVMVEDVNSDYSSHLYVISTANDQVVLDQPLSFDPVGMVITPVNAAGKVYGYLLGLDMNQGYKFAAIVIDLNEGSKTFGQPLPQTEVFLNTYFFYSSTAVINGDGSRLVVGGYKASNTGSPNPNVVELDTAKMLTNPSQAILGSTTLGGGTRPHGFTIATISKTSPATAPTVTKVSPAKITNDVDNTLTITGTNFAKNATVRIGTFPPLPATVSSSTSLQVNVGKDFPAQASLDVVVTNPRTNGMPSQQYESGLLPGALTVLPNPQFQPKNQFAVFNISTYSVSVYNLGQQTMINVPNSIVPYGIAFSTDGAGIYGPSYGPRGVNSKQVAEWNPLDDSLKAQIPLSGVQSLAQSIGDLTLSSSIDPGSGDPVVFVPTATYGGPGDWDIGVQMVDTKSNTVTKVLAAGLGSDYAYQYGGVATPDGKYVYVAAQYYPAQTSDSIIVFDVLNGTITLLDTATLGVAPNQSEMTVSPDGQSLLLQGVGSGGSPIAVFDISANPKNPTLVTTIAGNPPPGSPPFGFYNWKVAAGRLFAMDYTQNAVVAFNFDRAHNNFSQLNYYLVPLGYSTFSLAVSPDGNLIYVPIQNYDAMGVLDANALVNGQNPLITLLGAFVNPYQVIVSPVAQHDKVRQPEPPAESNPDRPSRPIPRATSSVQGRSVQESSGNATAQPSTHEFEEHGSSEARVQ